MTNITQADRDAAALITRSTEIMKDWIDRQPQYQGDDSRAAHYRENRAALDTGLSELTRQSNQSLEDKLESALCADKWSASLTHIHKALAMLEED